MFRMMPKDYAPPAPSTPDDAAEPDVDQAGGPSDGDPDDASQGMDEGGTGKVGAQTAGYRDPQEGPFMCSNCSHMVGDSQCEILSDPIDPDGLCNLFWSKNPSQDDTDLGMEGESLEGTGMPEATDVEPAPGGPQG